MCLVTVIIPYFRKKSYIKKTLESVIIQSYKNLEIIIIYDDQDKSELEFLKKLTKKDKRINLKVNKKNLGAGNSRNFGIKIAKGKYIAFLDSDDLWKKEKIKYQLQFMKKNNLKISHTAYEVVDANDNIKSIRKSRIYDNYNDLLKSCDIGLSTVMIYKNIISNNLKFPNLVTKEDFVLWLKLLKNGYKIGYLDKNLTSWRNLSNSLSSSILQKFKDGFIVYYKYMNFNIFKSIYYLFILGANSLNK
ncbi:glycosyltransferase family 2 protein [Candidatus Pelagibacter sp.]|nr:glycosyltransferase family 2 protein [Candidatus Pelagibacter sp.]